MCGVVGIAQAATAEAESAAVLAGEALLLLQHRGQDACGIISLDRGRLAMHKGFGLVSETFRQEHLEALRGGFAIGHVRYSTAGAATAMNEIQPFYVNSPFGMSMVHNGNITNCDELREYLAREGNRHINSESDSEVLLNLFAHELMRHSNGRADVQSISDAVGSVHRICKGAYSVCVLIADYGLVAFRDPYGIRPLAVGRSNTGSRASYMVASESVALANLGYELVGDVEPGAAVIIDQSMRLTRTPPPEAASSHPCLFEYVYLARPDSVIEQALVYDTRVNMGSALARLIASEHRDLEIDVVIPVPDSSRPTAMQLAQELNLPYREGFVKNRYIGRTFIMPDPELRRKSVRRKLSIIASEFAGKRVLLVDDSIVRGTTGREIVQMAREAGPQAIHFASAAPPVRHQNVYGIDMPRLADLVAAKVGETEVGEWMDVDRMIYQKLDGLVNAVRQSNPSLNRLETSCFSGEYLPGTVSEGYLERLENTSASRSRCNAQTAISGQMDLSLAIAP